MAASIEIALGPKGAFENGNIGTLTRQVPGSGVVSAFLSQRDKPKPPRELKTPRVVALLRKSIEWQELLESGHIANQAEIARREGISRARVTQVMGMRRLAPEIKEQILSMPDGVSRPPFTERMLRPLESIADSSDQLRELRKLLA
ncbi:MAG: hypothetical protein WC899_10795 [bacterium]